MKLRYKLLWAYILGALVIYELVAQFDGNPETPPLTQVTITYIPWILTMTVTIWLPIHFGIRYWRKRKNRKLNENH